MVVLATSKLMFEQIVKYNSQIARNKDKGGFFV